MLKPSRSSSVRGGDFDLSSPTPLRPRPRARPPHQSSRLRPPLGGVVAIGVAIGLCKGVVGRCQRRCQWRCRRGLHNRPTHQPRARRGSMYAACLAAIVDGAPPSAHHVHQRGGLGTIWRTSARWKPQRQPQATSGKAAARKQENVSTDLNFAHDPSSQGSLIEDVNAHEAHVRGRKGRAPRSSA